MDIKKGDDIEHSLFGIPLHSKAYADLQLGEDRIEVESLRDSEVTYHVQLTAIISVQRVIEGEGTVTVYDANAPH